MITKISAYIMPFVILIIVGYGMYKKSDNYDNFVNGAEDGMRTVVSIAPTLIGLMVAVGVLRASGFLDFIAELLSGVWKAWNTSKHSAAYYSKAVQFVSCNRT